MGGGLVRRRWCCVPGVVAVAEGVEVCEGLVVVVVVRVGIGGVVVVAWWGWWDGCGGGVKVGVSGVVVDEVGEGEVNSKMGEDVGFGEGGVGARLG